MNRRLTEEEASSVIALYSEFGNVWKVGEILGRCGQSIHEFLTRRGVIQKMNTFDDFDILREKYIAYRDAGKLQDLANELGRTKQFICRKAKEIGLTEIKYQRSKTHEENVKKGALGRWDNKPHPRGMLGKTHSDEYKEVRRKSMKKAWSDPSSTFNSPEHRKMLSDRMSYFQNNHPNKSANYSRTKKGWFIKDGIPIAMRSSWEFNYAHYPNTLLDSGKIISWQYEAKSFKFPELIFGCRTYTPDFLVINNKGEEQFHEVKGWMDNKSQLKFKLMKKYFPDVKIKLIDELAYREIEKKKDTIPNWGEWLTKKPDANHTKLL
jgi:hypothetical protein